MNDPKTPTRRRDMEMLRDRGVVKRGVEIVGIREKVEEEKRREKVSAGYGGRGGKGVGGECWGRMLGESGWQRRGERRRSTGERV